MVDSPRARPQGWRPAARSALVYIAATLTLGREILRDPAGRVLHDAGDPLLTSAIFRWNATHLPLTGGWWQFPIFFPTRNALTFSEHLLGLSPLTTPLERIIDNPIVTYNIVALLTFPLCAIAMYALVYRLTRSAAGAFVGGIAFGFAPYRIAQLPHIQMLAAFYAPIALLGLHAYIESGRRRWLVLYGACWLLQGMANGYCVFFLSLLVGLWSLWFVIVPGRWRALAEITAATLVAAIPLALVLHTYLVVHQFQGFARTLIEMREFSGDVTGLMCAASDLSFWGWLQVGCRAEGQLFPGVATFALFILGVARIVGWPHDRGATETPNWIAFVVALVAFALALTYAVCVVAVAINGGPVRLDAAFLHVSASNVPKLELMAIVALALALVVAPVARHGMRGPAPLPFYVVGAIVTWALALGPSIIVRGVDEGIRGPFGWLLPLPGVDSLRVPARFWLMTVLCLSVVAGVVVSELLKNRRRTIVGASVALLGCVVFADGAVNHFVWEPAPRPLPNEAGLVGRHVMFLPVGQRFDIPTTYRAVVDHWYAVNGYSGYVPIYYPAVLEAVHAEDPALFEAFQRYGPLDVIVRRDAPRLRAIVEQQPGVEVIARGQDVAQYRLPARPVEYTDATGRRLPIARVTADCAQGTERYAIDGNLESVWACPQTHDATLTIDLGQVDPVGAVVTDMGRYAVDYAHALTVDTSVDAGRWDAAWSGSALGPTVWSAIEQPKLLPVTISFRPRQARFIRLRQTGRDLHVWAIAELQVFSH